MKEKEIVEKGEEAKLKASTSYFQGAGGLLKAFTILAGKESKAVFAIGKALQISQALVAAYAAFNQALAHPPGPPTTIPVAAAALAAGLGNVATIAAASFGGRGGGGGGAIAATPTTPTPTPVTETQFADSQPTYTFNIEGDVLADEGYIEKIAEKFSEAVEGREVRLVASEVRVT